tara:strand:- start:1427 stop:2119 length:693 start_codon:yes stop_codon:yes gene_type:complete
VKKKKIISIIIFPGSNCDRDLMVAIKRNLGIKPNLIWHQTGNIEKTDLIFLPGGFSYGDYLRAGIIATKSPAISEVVRLSKKGLPIVGICNGFQILTECNLLDGALLKNSNQLFKCKDVFLKVVSKNKFTSGYKKNEIISYPIAHSQGNFFVNDQKLKELEDNDQIIFKYTSKKGLIDKNFNPNGSKNNIAGIVNKKKNVLGLMPHPERATDNFSSGDGKIFFKSIYEML